MDRQRSVEVEEEKNGEAGRDTTVAGEQTEWTITFEQFLARYWRA